VFGFFVPDDWSFLQMLGAAVAVGAVWGIVIVRIAVWDDRRRGVHPPPRSDTEGA